MEAAPIRHALRRGAFHTAVGLTPAVALVFFPRPVVLAALAAVTVILLSLEAARLRIPFLRRLFSAWLAPFLRIEEERKLTGSSYLLIGCLVTALAFPRDIAFLAIVFLSLGDPAATVAGTWKGRTRLWGKTVEGDTACLVICLLAGNLVAAVLKSSPLVVAVTGAIFATIFQALPRWLDDNLTIPLGSAAAMLAVSILI